MLVLVLINLIKDRYKEPEEGVEIGMRVLINVLKLLIEKTRVKNFHTF